MKAANVRWPLFALYLLCLPGGYVASSILILGVFPFTSHVMVLIQLANELSTRGHDVNFMAVQAPKLHPNVTFLQVENVVTFSAEVLRRYENGTALDFAFLLWDIGLTSTEKLLSKKAMQQMINARVHEEKGITKDIASKSYDVIIAETYFLQEAIAAGFTQKYNCPLINYQAITMTSQVSKMTGNPNNPAMMADYKLRHSSKMNFLQRLHNTFIYLFQVLYYDLFYLPKQDQFMRKYFSSIGAHQWPYIGQILQDRQALTLVDSHFLLTDAKPYNPNTIEIGGLHIKPPKLLPKDIEDFILNSGEHGFIYFSLGSHLDAENLEPWKKDVLVSLFGSLKQNIICKLHDPELQKKMPPNVKMGKWFPQTDILAHPKCKLFITHGGMHSAFEAIYYKVPVLIIPFFADQKQNGFNAIDKGYGDMIDYHSFQLAEFKEKINRILYETRYQTNVAELSEVFRAEPMSPLDRTTYYIEYVIKHKGAKFWKSRATDLAWYQYYLVDIAVFVLSILAACVYIMYKLFKFIIYFIGDNSGHKQLAKKKKK